VISRVCVEHEHVDCARQASEGTWQIALFVAGENDGSDQAWVQVAASRRLACPSIRS
jgi:hypothetical protein